MQQMPKEFDEETEEAAMVFAQEEMKDPIDKNFKKRLSRSPSRRIFEHIPTGTVLTVGLDDIIDIDSSEDDEKKKKLAKRKKRKFDPTSTPSHGVKKPRHQFGKGVSFPIIKWEKY